MTRAHMAFWLSLLAAFALPGSSPAQARGAIEKPTRVLFICQAGTVKSPIARELFKRRAAERGIKVTAFSRGIQPAQHVTPALEQKLQADGINTTSDPLMRLKRTDLKSADLIVTFHDLPTNLTTAPKQKKKLQDWTSVPSMNDAYSSARADLDGRIDRLLDAVEAKKRRP